MGTCSRTAGFEFGAGDAGVPSAGPVRGSRPRRGAVDDIAIMSGSEGKENGAGPGPGREDSEPFLVKSTGFKVAIPASRAKKCVEPVAVISAGG